MKRVSAVVLTLFIALAAAGAKKNTAYVCSLTNKKISSCCCTKKNGELYCTLAKQTVPTCCCKVSASTKNPTR